MYIMRKLGNKAYLFMQEILHLEALVEDFQKLVAFICIRIMMTLIFHRSIFSVIWKVGLLFKLCFETEPFLSCLWTILNWRILQIVIFQTIQIFQISLTGKLNWNSKVKRLIYQRSSLSWLLNWDKNASTFSCGGKPCWIWYCYFGIFFI